MIRYWMVLALLVDSHHAVAQSALPAASSAETGFTPGIAYERRHVDYIVERDGRFVKEIDSIRVVLNDTGVREVAQISQSYSASLETAEIVLARLITPDGKEIDVPPSAIFVQEPYASQAAPMFSDQKVKTIVFPQVTPGAKILLKTRVTQRVPILPGQFSAMEFISPHSARQDFVFTVTAPADMPLDVQTIDLPHVQETLTDGRVKHVFSSDNAKAVAPEAGSVARSDYSPRMVVSTMADGAALATAYGQLTGDISAPTARVIALADQLTQGVSDPRKQTEALYNWVHLNIRYVNVVLERGGFIPRPLDSILSNAYGDCKDQAVLLGALLRAKGIDSTPVLIGAGNAFWMPRAGTLQAFNHMITYVPQLNLYLDSTARYNAFGTLPFADGGKQVLHVKSGQWASTPLSDGGLTAVKQVIDVARDESAVVKTSVRGTGLGAATLRGTFAAMQSISDAQVVTSMLAQAGANGTGVLRRPGLRADSAEAEFGLDYDTKNFLDLPGPGAIRMPPSGFNALAPWVASLRTERHYPYGCPNGEVSETVELKLPDNVRLLRDPPSEHHTLDVTGSRIEYRQTVQREAGSLKLVRTMTMVATQPVCAGTDMEAQKVFARKVERSLRTQLLYE